jgi:hypothetical protein
MQPIFRVVVNYCEERRVSTALEADALCSELAKRPVFTGNAYTGQGIDPCLDIIVESERAHVFYMDIARQVKLVSRNQKCIERGTVSLSNDEYPDLNLDLIEVQRRSLISPERAIAIFRHYLKTGQPIDLVPWPSPDEAEWDGDLTPDGVQPPDETGPVVPGEEIPF